MTESSRAVFLSYASQDAEAAQRICESLRAAGIEVWFDQSELRGGDAWDAAIRKQIRACGLFIPVISANTDVRTEGYFRLEWKLAVDRSHLMASDRVASGDGWAPGGARSSREPFEAGDLRTTTGELVRATATEAERGVALFERAVELARHQAAHLLELRALTSLVHASQDSGRTAELLPRVAALLEQLTLRPESADAREARLLVAGPQANAAVRP